MTTWVKVFNSLPHNQKFLKAGDRAGWLYLCGLCYANEHLTNGFIAEHALPAVAPGVKAPEHLAERLVAADLWHRVEGGWTIHDYGEHQRSADEIRERRARDAERKANGRREMSNGSPRGQVADSAPIPEGVRDVDVEGREQKADVEEHLVAAAPPRDQTDIDVEELCALLSHHVRTAHGIDPSSKEARVTKGWRDACRSMLTLDGYTREQIAYAIEWVCRHHYWRNRVKSMTRLRSEMGQVVNEIREQREGKVVPMQRRESASDMLRALDGGAA